MNWTINIIWWVVSRLQHPSHANIHASRRYNRSDRSVIVHSNEFQVTLQPQRGVCLKRRCGHKKG